MSSIRRILSNRANGARSRGPVTVEGKRRSSLNAVSHGLLSDCVLLPGESRESFQQLIAAYFERFGPVDAVELGMIEEMAAASWRLRRAWAIENKLLADEMDSQPLEGDLDRIAASFRTLASSPELALLHRYETRLHVMYQRAFQNMLLLRTPGIRNEPSPIFGQLDLASAARPALPPPVDSSE